MRTESDIIETHRADTKDMQHNTVTHAFLFGFGCRNWQVCHLKYRHILSSILWRHMELDMTLLFDFCFMATASFLTLLHYISEADIPFFLNLKTTLQSDFLLSRFYTSIIVVSLINNHSFSFHLWGRRLSCGFTIFIGQKKKCYIFFGLRVGIQH